MNIFHINSAKFLQISHSNFKFSIEKFVYKFFYKLKMFLTKIIEKCLKLYTITIAIAALCSYSDAKEITCESTNQAFYLNFDSLTTCFMNETSIINDSQTRFSNLDESITMLWFLENQKISFLPLEVKENFPNLRVYVATACSIEKIAKKHFMGFDEA